MTNLRTAPTDTIVQILGVFSRVEWPLHVNSVDTVVSSLGWTRRDNPTRIDVSTNLALNHNTTTFLNENGVVLEIECFVCDAVDRLTDPTPVKEAYQSLKTEVVSVLGKPDGSRSGDAWWDLSTGGRVHVKNLTRVVALQLLSHQYADIERGEARHQISPGRVLGEDE